jgi:RNA polymerase sigma-70 factor (ECF subfamily)
MSWGADSSDEELMLLYRDGEAGAFDVLYARHKGGLYRYLLRQCRDAAVAEELFQDVWMNLIRARAAYTVQAKFTTYLYRLAYNRLIDHYRSRNAQAVTSSFEQGDGEALEEVADEREPAPDAALDARRQAQQLLALISELPEAQRAAFLMQQEGGMSVEEIAQATGVTRETAKSRLRYAMAKLRQGMREWR